MGQTAVDLADLTIPPAFVQAPGEAAAAAVATVAPPGALVIVTVPAAARPLDGRAVVAMVAQAVRGVVARPAESEGGIGAADLETEAMPDGGDAVVAAHDARIAILRQRLAALHGVAGTTRLVDDLGARMLRAEAARRLAVARVAGDGVPAPECRGDASPWCRDRLAPVLAGDGHAAPPGRRIAVAPPRARGGAGGLASPNRLAWRSVVALHREWGPPHRRILTALVAPPGLHAVRFHAAPPRLAAACRSLAIARALLGGEPIDRPAAGARIAGLWRWDGSDRWALRPDLT